MVFVILIHTHTYTFNYSVANNIRKLSHDNGVMMFWYHFRTAAAADNFNGIIVAQERIVYYTHRVGETLMFLKLFIKTNSYNIL